MVRFLQRVHIKKIHGIYCVRRAEERGCVVFLGTALFFSLQNGQTGPISLLSLSDHFGEIFPARVSSDNPRLKAFCRVAPSVLFNLRAISAARLLLRASLFNVRICSAVHARLFICPPLIIKIVVAPIVTILPRPDSDLNHSYLYLLGARADSTSGVSRDPYKRGARTGMSQPAAVLATA
jgi:hypothetical protein